MQKSVLLLILLTGCSTGNSFPQSPEPNPTPIILSTPTGEDGQPRLIPLRVTLSNPKDLKITQGDVIYKGQVLSDREDEREKVTSQLDKLRSNLKRLQAIAAISQTNRKSIELPPPSYLEQQRAIESQQITLADITTEIQNQELKLTQLNLMEELPESVEIHEQAVLRELQEKKRRQEATVKYVQAQLETAKQQRKYQEYQHAIDQENRHLEATKQQQTLALNQSQIVAEISKLEGDLKLLSTVKSPFSGRVSRIKWVGQNDQSLIVELAIIVNPRQPQPPTFKTSQLRNTALSRQ